MSEIVFVQDDTGPSVSGALTDSTGVPIDLTSATVRFQMRLAVDRRFAVDAPAVIVNADAGTVRYDWVAGDLRGTGDYVSRWQITYGGGTVEHTEPENTITVEPA